MESSYPVPLSNPAHPSDPALPPATDVAWVVTTLTTQRDEILGRWLTDAATQTFHHGRRDHAVADHIPQLFDALVNLLATKPPRWLDPTIPLDDVAVLVAAESHARMRAEQGLQPADVVVEFRLLRQEIWRALRAGVPHDVPSGEVIGAEMVVNDALDGAITLALVALTDRVEQIREEFVATTLHEVRQPITVIAGEAQMAERVLAKAVPDIARAQQATARIRSAVRRMNEVFSLLADVSKIALGNLELTIQLIGGRDQGIGISAEDLPRLFSRYGRAKEAKAQGIEGLGLGLYLCRSLVEAHGGRIWAESVGQGRGTAIYVRLGSKLPELRSLPILSAVGGQDMTLQRMDNVLIVVEDLEGVKAFFIALGMELEGEPTVEGPAVDQLLGLPNVRATLAVLRTPDGHGRIELDKFHTPAAIRTGPANVPVNALGIRRIMFAVAGMDEVIARLRAHGGELVGDVVQYGDTYRLGYVRGPEGIIVGLAEQLR